MHLLEFVPFFSVFAIASLGLGSIALSLMVWRRRRHALQQQVGWWATLSRLVLPLAFLGSLLIILSLSLRTFFPRRGEVFVRETVVVRAAPERGVPSVQPKDEFKAGDVLASFARPGDDSEVARLEVEQQRLEAERSQLEEAPLVLDPALVRERQELTAERRNLAHRLALYQVEQQRLEQQARSDILDKRVQRHEIHVQLGEYDGRLAKLAAEIAYESRLLEQGKDLRKGDLLSELGYAERLRNTSVLQADSARLEKERTEKLALLAELDRGITGLEEVLAKHAAHVETSSAQIKNEMQHVEQASSQLDARLVKEEQRLQRRRVAELRDLELRKADCGHQLGALLAREQIRCTTAGRMLFRHPSPAAAQTGEPILMFGSQDAVRARFRLGLGDAERLRAAGEIELLATSKELIESRLTGRVVTCEPLMHEEGMVIAELACTPTPSQSRYLARGLNLDVRLLWAPSPLSDPLLLLGIALMLLSLTPSLVVRSRRAPRLDVDPVLPTHTTARRARSG